MSNQINSGYQPQDYRQHGSKRPIHIVSHTDYFSKPISDKYEQYRRTAIIHGVTVRAQRLNDFSRALNQFTTTRERKLAININGKTKTTGWRQGTSANKRGMVPKLVPSLPERGLM